MTPSCVDILLVLQSRIIPRGEMGTYWSPRIKPKLATCKENTHCTISLKSLV